jgi:hypothetical protein
MLNTQAYAGPLWSMSIVKILVAVQEQRLDTRTIIVPGLHSIICPLAAQYFRLGFNFSLWVQGRLL